MSRARLSNDDEAIRLRRGSMDDARAILAISGGSLSLEAERLTGRVVAGELTDDEAIAELLRQDS